MQTFDQLRSREPHQQQAQPLLPHTHWQYWLQFSAEDFPASATRAPQKPDSSQAPQTVAATCDSSSSRGCNSQQADSTGQQPVAIVAGACDITILKRSLVQQLYNAAPAPFKGPAASALKAPLKGSSSSQSAQQAVTEGLQPASSSEQRRNRLSNTRDQILLRVAPGHKGFVAGLVSDILQDQWMQKQQKYLRLVSTPYSNRPGLPLDCSCSTSLCCPLYPHKNPYLLAPQKPLFFCAEPVRPPCIGRSVCCTPVLLVSCQQCKLQQAVQHNCIGWRICAIHPVAICIGGRVHFWQRVLMLPVLPALQLGSGDASAPFG